MPDFTVNWSPTSIFEKFLSHLKGRENLRFLEIGVLEGQGTRYLFENFLGKTGSMVCIDPFIDYSKATVAKITGYDHIINEALLDRFRSNVDPFLDRIFLLKDLSQNVLQTLQEGTFDMSFVDGDHSRDAVAVDARESLRLVKVGGYIIFDDYSWGYEKSREASPKDAIDGFLKTYRSQVKMIHQGWCVVVQKLAC
jgi:predicted O-methyltransferase YrrM